MVERKTDNLAVIGSKPILPSTMIEYLGVQMYIRLATGLGIVILLAAAKVRPRRLDLEKATAYECGFEPFGEARSPFDIGFYQVAIQFLVFDLEVAFQLPWVLGGISTGYRGFFTFVLFCLVLVLGFVFEWQKGAQDWTSFIPFLSMFLLVPLEHSDGTPSGCFALQEPKGQLQSCTNDMKHLLNQAHSYL